MKLTRIGDYKIRLRTIDSTNNYAASLFALAKPVEGTVVLSEFQETGKGQYSTLWESEKGKNLLASFILYPRLDVSDFFYLNQCISLAVCDAVLQLLPGREVQIKWPNDVLVDNRKIAGILIENNIRGNQFAYSIAGIGININQKKFRKYHPPATSVAMETGKTLETDEALQALCQSLNTWYTRLRLDDLEPIRTQYLDSLFGYRKKRTFKNKDGKFEATITGVREDGKLELKNTSGEDMRARFKEIEFLF